MSCGLASTRARAYALVCARVCVKVSVWLQWLIFMDEKYRWTSFYGVADALSNTNCILVFPYIGAFIFRCESDARMFLIQHMDYPTSRDIVHNTASPIILAMKISRIMPFYQNPTIYVAQS